MEREEIESKLILCVADSLAIEIDDIHTKSILVDELGADSLDFMDIMFHIEEAFGIQMQREDLNFLSLIELSEDKAVVDGILTDEAKQLLTKWMPELDMEKPLKPASLSRYLSIESLTFVTEIIIATQHEKAELSAEDV